jgi:cytochrome c oxidase cbb3-type subunit III
MTVGEERHALPAARWNRRGVYAAVGIALSILAVAGLYASRQLAAASRLLRTDPGEILNDPRLLQRAISLGKPLFRAHCATCHGLALEGSASRGVPNLARQVWLYGGDPVKVEQTILYGIRSGHPRARNVTDMPALVRSGQISADDAHDVTEFVESLGGVPYDREMAQRGRVVYETRGNCGDCHASDGQGVSDYGAPSLKGPVWLYGGDRRTLFDSIVNGRHGICPAWRDKLTPLQIRSLTLYLVTAPKIIAASSARG